MIIRPYKEKDKTRLRMICKETAFEDYKKDQNKLESVPIMFNDYFTEKEPDYIFVIADENDDAFGYIICATSYEKFTAAMKTEYTERLLKTAPDEVIFLNDFLEKLSCIRDRAVHFHIDMLPQCQRQGMGHQLIDTLCRRLEEDGYDHLSVCCAHRKAASYALCMKMGFEEIYDYGNDLVSISKRLGGEVL